MCRSSSWWIPLAHYPWFLRSPSYLVAGTHGWHFDQQKEGGHGEASLIHPRKKANHVETDWRCGNVACLFQLATFWILWLCNRYRCRSLHSLQEIEGGQKSVLEAKDAVHAVLLRSARAAKLGARAGRIFKLVMCYSLLIRGPEGEELKTRHQDTWDLRCLVCVCLFFVGGWLVIVRAWNLTWGVWKCFHFNPYATYMIGSADCWPETHVACGFCP